MKADPVYQAVIISLWLVILFAFPINLLIQPQFLKLSRPAHPALAQATLESWHDRAGLSQLGYTPAEVGHLLDVSRLTSIAVWACLLALLVVIFLARHDLKEWHSARRLSAKIALVLIMAASLGYLLFWRPAFTLFHQVFFPQGNWAFPADSLLISTFSETFWQFSFAAYAVLVVCFCLLNLVTPSGVEPEFTGSEPTAIN